MKKLTNPNYLHTLKTNKLQEFYEAEFGLQGARIDNLNRDELVNAIVSGKADVKAPARGSAIKRSK